MALQAAQLIVRTRSVRLLVPDRRLWSLAADLAAGLRLRCADALYVSTAQHLGEPLVTFDPEQARRAAAVVQVIQPGRTVDR